MAKVDVVVMAAGIGSRLAPLTDTCPKCLIEVAGKSILARNLDILYGDLDRRIASISVVIGYRAEQVVDVMAQRFPRVRWVWSANYRSTNNMHSLYLGLSASSWSNDLLTMNGDCVYDPAILGAALAADDDSILVDSARTYDAEAMKVAVRDGRITAIDKAIPPGEGVIVSIDTYYMSARTRRILSDIIDGYQARGDRNRWTEVALDAACKRDDVCFRPTDVAGKRWYEIDNHADLTAANAMFGPA